MNIYLETSSYLPLLWATPYTKSVVNILEQRRGSSCTFVLQRDCIAEASGYLSFKNDWRYHPAVRIRTLIKNLGAEGIRRLSFPSTAVQLLLGGNIWPQAQYLNFVRHTAFFFTDLLDDFSFQDSVSDLTLFAERIEKRVEDFRRVFQEHASASVLQLPTSDILPYWGSWYLAIPSEPFEIRIIDDLRPYHLASDKLRDVYHYDCAVNADERPNEMIIANTGFKRNVQTSFTNLPVPLVCATTATSIFFG